MICLYILLDLKSETDSYMNITSNIALHSVPHIASNQASHALHLHQTDDYNLNMTLNLEKDQLLVPEEYQSAIITNIFSDYKNVILLQTQMHLQYYYHSSSP